ncbi:hypothetical protein HK104_002288, partial [Borealophlyctis nickersoniae]
MSRKVVRALYDYNGAEESSLSFRQGDIIQVLNQLESGWWDGLCRGERGWFPSNYVSPVETVVDAPEWDQPQSGPWVRQLGEGGSIYWYHSETGETTMDEPAGLDFQEGRRATLDTMRDSGYQSSASTGGSLELPPGWIVFEAEDGSTVYYNATTKETRWTPPEGSGSSIHSPMTASTPLSAGPMSPPAGMAPPSARPRSNSMSASRPPPVTEGLPNNWGRKMTPEGRVYYYNMLTDETTWNIEDIDMQTGELINKRNSQDSYQSTSSSDARNAFVPTDDSPDSRWSWSKLTGDILQAIHQLSTSAKQNHKERFIPQSSAIVESIRVMLYASGTARKDAPLVASHKMLKMHHRQIMSALSKLVLAGKLASGVWPPPDAVFKMQQAANEVLLAVRHFVAAAQEAGVEIRAPEEDGAASHRREGSVSSGQGSDRAGDETGADGGASNGGGPGMPGPQGATTNSELIAHLERYTRSVCSMISTMINSVRANECNSSSLITQVRSMVTEVGNFLALVDELPLDSLSDDLTVDFKVNRLALYNSISGLVMATQTATNPLAPSNAVEEVIITTNVVEKAVKDLLISTKFLIEEKESLEQVTLQTYIDQYGSSTRRSSEISMKPRRAMSMTLAEQNSSSSSATGGPMVETPKSESQNPLDAVYEVDERGLKSAGAGPVPSVGPDNEAPFMEDGTMDRRTSSKSASKIQQLLGAESPTVSVVARNKDSGKPWFLAYDYAPEDIMFNNEGKVKGATLEALVERLTIHDSL